MTRPASKQAPGAHLYPAAAQPPRKLAQLGVDVVVQGAVQVVGRQPAAAALGQHVLVRGGTGCGGGQGLATEPRQTDGEQSRVVLAEQRAWGTGRGVSFSKEHAVVAELVDGEAVERPEPAKLAVELDRYRGRRKAGVGVCIGT